MKKLLFSLLVIAFTVVLGGCQSSKQIPYFTNIDSISLEASRGLFDAKIMPKDGLVITVNTTDPRAAVPFNLNTGNNNNIANAKESTYLVDNNGYINFPIIGLVKVSGLTKRECEAVIHDRIKPYMAEKENPIITVRMSSFRVCVYGEVNKPGEFVVETEKISLPEALAQAGDLTIYGKRQNVLLIREDGEGRKSAHRLDLTDANIIKSPYYYLQQNDQIYVEPNKTKKRNSIIGSSTSIWIASISSLTSITSLIVTLVRL